MVPQEPPGTAHAGHGAEDQHLAAAGHRFQGAQIPEQAYREDTGEAAAHLAEAVTARDVTATVAALRGERLLVALVARLDSATAQGVEKDSHMAAAMWQRPDGRVALLAFTSVAAMAAWDEQARPLPVPAAQVAQAALEDGADAVLVDRAVALTGPALWAVAEGRELLAPETDPQVGDIVRAAAVDVLAAAALPTQVVLAPGEGHSLTILVHPRAAEQPSVLHELARRLSAEPVLRARVAGMQIGVAPVSSPDR